MKRLALILSIALVFTACAKNRGVETLRHDVNKDWLLKPDFTGTKSVRDVYFAKVTAVKTSVDGGFIFAGYQSDMKAGYFEFTEDKLQFKSMQGIYKGRETSLTATPILFQWGITHHEAQLQTIDGKTTNKEIDDDRKPWYEKKNFKIDFASPDISEEGAFWMQMGGCFEVASRTRVPNSVQIEPGYISFLIETVYRRNCPDSQNVHEGHNTFTVQYRYSFRRMEANDYEPFFYEGEQDPRMRKFGYFQSIKGELSEADGLTANLFLVNRWNPKKEHDFYFTKDFPAQYKHIFYDIFDKTNEVFKNAGLKTRFHLRENNYGDGKAKEFGDLRYAFINLVEELDPSAPLGYGPSDANPFTGEIISATLNIWSGYLKYYIKVLEASAKRDPQWFNSGGEWLKDPNSKKWSESDLFTKMGTVLQKTPDQWTEGWDDRKDMRDFFQHMVSRTTYGYPGWNSFTKSSELQPAVAVLEHPSKESSSGIGVKADSLAFDATWKQNFFNFHNMTQNTYVDVKKLIDYKPLEQNPVFAALTNAKSKGAPPLEILKEFSTQMDKFQHAEMNEVSLNRRGHCRLDMQATMAGMERVILESGFTAEQIIETVLYRTAIHEFGHNLNLRHNFYGSVDKTNFLAPSVPVMAPKFAKNDKGEIVKIGVEPVPNADGSQKMWPSVSSSVMDYTRLQDEFYSEHAWEPYDIAAIRYAYSGGKLDDKKLYLFCTDEHTLTNAFCNRHDKGTTPTEIAMSFVEAYEDGYYTRNQRFGRAYWDTSDYAGRVFTTMKELKEFLPMWRTAFYESHLRDELKKKGVNKDASEQMVTEISREIKESLKIIIAFYQSVIQQSAADKPYRSEYDEFTGALKRVGIGFDKQAAMYFLAGDAPLLYNQNRIMLDASLLTYQYVPEFASLMEKVNENIVTQRVDMEPWFISFGRALYAQSAMNFSNREDESLINKLKIKRYTPEEIGLYFGVNTKDPQFSKVANLVTLPFSSDQDFQAGEEVAIVLVNARYYVFSKQASPFAFDIYKNLKQAEEFENPSVEPKLDLQELFMIYTLTSGGTL